MPIDLAAPFERLMNACNDKDFSWWPLVHCRPVSTDRFGRRAVAAMSVVTLAWVMMALAATPAVVVFIAKTVNRNFTIVDYQQYMAAVRWMDSSGLLDAVLCAAVIGWPLSIAWSAWAWNRRARRLSKAAELSTDVSVDTDVVWPPPPQ